MTFIFGGWLIEWIILLFTKTDNSEKEENEERHIEFQVPIGERGRDVHGAIESIGLDASIVRGIGSGLQRTFDNCLPSINCPFFPL